MQELGAFEAKNRSGHLLDLIEQGKEVRITRHGKEVARPVPARQPINPLTARAAIQRIRAGAEQQHLGLFDWAEWKADRDTGRP